MSRAARRPGLPGFLAGVAIGAASLVAPLSAFAQGLSPALPDSQQADAPPSAPAAPKAPQSEFAQARASSSATGDYFHDFNELIVRVHSVKWIADICSQAFPETAAVNEHAYNDWLDDHRAFVDEMEGQFAIIEKYWAQSSPNAVKEGYNADKLRAKVDANRDGLNADFHAKSKLAFMRRCEAYPEVLLSPQLDLEKSQAEYVQSVRMGPR